MTPHFQQTDDWVALGGPCPTIDPQSSHTSAHSFALKLCDDRHLRIPAERSTNPKSTIGYGSPNLLEPERVGD